MTTTVSLKLIYTAVHLTGSLLLDSDLSTAIRPAGNSFPEFLNLIPITRASTPEETEAKNDNSLYAAWMVDNK